MFRFPPRISPALLSPGVQLNKRLPSCNRGFAYYQHRQRLPARLHTTTLCPRRCFTSSPPLTKKKDKTPKTHSSNDSAKATSKVSDDPLDLSELHQGIENAIRRLGDDISKLSTGGRFNTEAIRSLRVHLVKGSKETVKLGELAQILPKGGRMVTVLAADEEVSRHLSVQLKCAF